MEIKLNKLGCFIFGIGIICIVREACRDIKELKKNITDMSGRLDEMEAINDIFDDCK